MINGPRVSSSKNIVWGQKKRRPANRAARPERVSLLLNRIYALAGLVFGGGNRQVHLLQGTGHKPTNAVGLPAGGLHGIDKQMH